MLQFDPNKRMTASSLLNHSFFKKTNFNTRLQTPDYKSNKSHRHNQHKDSKDRDSKDHDKKEFKNMLEETTDFTKSKL